MWYKPWTWLGNGKTDITSFANYSVNERLIYQYFDGTKVVRADPLILFKKVMNVGLELSVDMKVANSPMKSAGESYTKAVGKIRSLFAIKPFEEGGLTEVESFGLLNHFLDYCEQVKKNSSFFVTSSNKWATASAKSSDQTTTPISESGSTASDSSIDEPPKSPSEPESPSE